MQVLYIIEITLYKTVTLVHRNKNECLSMVQIDILHNSTCTGNMFLFRRNNRTKIKKTYEPQYRRDWYKWKLYLCQSQADTPLTPLSSNQL